MKGKTDTLIKVIPYVSLSRHLRSFLLLRKPGFADFELRQKNNQAGL